MTIDEVREFIRHLDKQVSGNVVLKPASNHHQAYEFRRQVDYDGEQEVSLKIWFNPCGRLPKLEIAFFVAGVGRIYGLCMNKSHAGMLVHKHNGKREDDNPYAPIDITAPANDPQAVWLEFCAESSLVHNGVFLVERRGPWTPPLTEA